MRNWLDVERVLLLRSPPGSGKTSFAIRFAVYLNVSVSVAYFRNASRILQLLNTGMSMDDAWKEQFRLSLKDIINKSRNGHIYIIIDEGQAWYPGNGLRREAERELEIKEQRDWITYIAEWARGASESVAAASEKSTKRYIEI
jgi:hypothetical protein